MHKSLPEQDALDIASGIKPLTRFINLREVVRQFTPNWFAVIMGTGILALALAALPFNVPYFYLFGRALWLIDIVLFILFVSLYTARWLFFYEGARQIFGHAVVSMFFGCIPMALATIANGFLVFGIPWLGEVAVQIAKLLWVTDAVMALICGVSIPFMMFTRQRHSIEQMSAVWLLPVVAAEVSAVSGGLLLSHITDVNQQISILIACYTLWACSVPLAMSILVILVLRMAINKLPPVEMAASSWLAVGPIGTGALGLLILGGETPAIFLANHLNVDGQSIKGFCLIVGLLLWGYGIWWAAIAVLITLRYFKNKVPFNLGWWGYIFPLAVYSLATLRLATELNFPFLARLGGFCILATLTIWLLIIVRTLRGAWRGDLFVSPCIKDMPSN